MAHCRDMAKIAIIETGGKQYVVTDGSVLNIEKMSDKSGSKFESKDAHKPGDKITFDKVLLTDDGAAIKVGAPYIEGAQVSAELIEEGKNATVTVIRYREKSRSFKKNGHRQPYAKVRITALP